jgi:hypothetical protein
MEKQQRKMMALQVALARERLPWFVSVASIFTVRIEREKKTSSATYQLISTTLQLSSLLQSK